MNISIAGNGTLDGEARYELGFPNREDSEISEETAIARTAGEDMRRSLHVGAGSHIIWIRNSTNVHINNVSIVNSPDWSVRIDNSERIFVQGVYIYSSLTMGVNGDGIDLVSSRDVAISDSVITTGDDSIVLKTIPMNGTIKPTENVTVTNCILTSSSTALMIGTETFADIRHVVFSNIVIRNANKGFGINVQDGATVSDVVVSNVTMELNRRHWNWWGSAERFKIVLKKREPRREPGSSGISFLTT
jgi:polygalacturonase